MTTQNGKPHDTGAHWQTTAIDGPVCHRLEEHLEADVVIVGGGLTGTRTALGLAEKGIRVVLLEQNEIGWGSSGRSGGQCNPIWRKTPDQLRERLGDAYGNRLIETTLTSADALFDDIKRYNINCDAEQNGWVQASHCAPATKDLEQLAAAWNADGAKIELLDKAQTHSMTGSQEYNFALFHPNGGFVQPLSMTRGFAKKAIEFGATLYENSPVTAAEKLGEKWRVSTAKGSVTATKVILTTNAYTDDLWPKLRQTIYPMVSVALATAPLSDNLQKTVLPNAVTISDTRRAIYFARYDRDRRLIFGCVGSNDSNPHAFGGVGRLTRGLHKVFPQLDDTAIESTWAGRIGVTPEMMPHLHEPEPGVLAALGFSGRGIAMTSVMARALVHKVLGGSDDELPFPITPVSPIPFHSLTTAALPLGAPAMTFRDSLDTIFARK